MKEKQRQEIETLQNLQDNIEKIEKRIKSFTSDWVYPSGSRLSNQIMAEAGFFYMGGSSVCCYYCGNKLQNFEPRYSFSFLFYINYIIFI